MKLLPLLLLVAPAFGQARVDVFGPPTQTPHAGFGRAIAASAGTRLVGAPGAAAGRGRVHVYRAGAQGPVLETTLVPTDVTVGAFGRALAVDGDRALVGAPRSDALGADSGAVYVYERRAAGWVAVQRLVATEGGPHHLFGWSVALDGDRAVVGAPFWNAHGHNLEMGAAYVFERDAAGQWHQVARLFDQISGAPGEWFGWSVDVDGDRLVAGVYHDDDAAFGAGSAWVFRRGSSDWLPEQQLRAFDPGLAHYFGVSLDLDGDDRLVVGAYRTIEGGQARGAAYYYERGATGWQLERKLTAPGLHHGSGFGGRVVLDGRRLAIGAVGQERGNGALFLYRQSPEDGWTLQARIDAPVIEDKGLFGWSLALDGDELWVGAPEEALGGLEAGTVTRIAWPAAPSPLCTPRANSTGVPGRMYLLGSSSLAEAPFTFAADGLVPSQPCWLVLGAAAPPAPFDRGVLCIGAQLARASEILVADLTGAALLEVVTGAAILAGDRLTFQVVYRDPYGASAGVNLSEAIAALFTL